MHMPPLNLPTALLVRSGRSREEILAETRFLLASKLFETGRLASGQAAQYCGMNRVEFLLAVGREGVPIADLDDDEMDREFADGR